MESRGFEGLACGAGLVNGEGLRGTGSLDRFVVRLREIGLGGGLRETGSWWGSAGSVRGEGSVGQVRGGSAGSVRGGAPRDQSCARRERWDRRSFRAAARRGSGCRRSYARSGPLPLPPRGVQRGTGSVPPIYTKGDTLYYSDVVAGVPRDRSCARCGLVEAHGGSGQVRRSECPNGAPHTSPG